MLEPLPEGTIYYSVGPLQHSGIEMWTWTGDRYDHSRLAIGNVFTCTEEAMAAKIKLTEFLSMYHSRSDRNVSKLDLNNKDTNE